MLEDDKYSDTLLLIYEAGLDFTLWPAALERLADLLGASMTCLVRHDPATLEGAMVTVRADPRVAPAYAKHYAKLNVFAQRAGNRPARTCMTDRAVLAKEELFKTEFYADFLRPQDVHSILSVYLLALGGTRVALGRPHRAGEWEEEQIDRLRLFAPHLHRAAEVNLRLESSRLGEEGAAKALDRLSQGVIIVDAGGRVFFANRTADAMFAEADGMAIDACGLCTANRSQTAALRRLIADAAAGRVDGDAGGALSVTRPSLRRSFSVLVAPLRTTQGWFHPQRSGAIVFIRDPERSTPAPATHLRQLYGLTRAEAALTIEIMQGGGLQAAPDAMGVTLSTARTHLQCVFEKTDTHRQAELVRLITEMQAGIAFDRLSL